ncbi:hypothetical protein [Streptomyces sp. NPDC056549]|uniref:hypothetical protein n=1 Tax=Streptomyces sp. NPDC056549 TaxID=3345864 RepID=UPI00368B90C3
MRETRVTAVAGPVDWGTSRSRDRAFPEAVSMRVFATRGAAVPQEGGARKTEHLALESAFGARDDAPP